MLFHHRHHNSKSPPPRLLKLSWLGVLSLIGVLLFQQSALAFSAKQMLESSGNPSLGYFGFSLFLSSLLVVESRRLKAFFVRGILLLGLLTVIALMSNYYLGDLYTEPLWLATLSGFGVGTVFVGGWWWGYHQGYGYAIADFLFRRHQYDPIFDLLVEHHAPKYANSAVKMGRFQYIQYKAAAVRYRRLLGQSVFKTLSILIHDQIRQDTQAEQAAQRLARKEQEQAKIRALITQADTLCNIGKSIENSQSQLD